MDAARTLLLTRPRAQSDAFAAALAERLPGRFRPVVAPLLAIRPVPGPLDLAGVQGLVFTSANGVEQFAARTAERGLPAFCVGDMTAAAAVRAGFAATSAGGDVAALAALLVAVNRQGAGPFLHVRGRLPRAISPAGWLRPASPRGRRRSTTRRRRRCRPQSGSTSPPAGSRWSPSSRRGPPGSSRPRRPPRAGIWRPRPPSR